MIKYKFKEWLNAAGLRAIKTAAEVAIGAIGSAKIVSEVDWKVALGTVILSVIMSFLVSLRGLPELDLQGKIERMQIGEQEGRK